MTLVNSGKVPGLDKMRDLASALGVPSDAADFYNSMRVALKHHARWDRPLPQFLASTPRRVTTTTTRTHQHHNADSGWRGDALAHGNSNFVSMAEEAWAATLKEVEKAISTRSTATAGGGREGERESWCG